MKKILLVLTLIVSLISLTSCNDLIPMENSVTMTLTDEWKDTITYKGSIPGMSFEYDGTFNVYETSSSLGYVFTKNDNDLLSEALKHHFETKVKDHIIVTEQNVQENDNDGAIFGDRIITLDEGTKSYEYTVVTWDETGTRYSYLYRSFISGGKTYYVYCYHTGITMSIEVPLIVQKVDDKQQVYMVSLPYDTIYKLNVNTKIKSLLNKKEYLEDEYHFFDYPNYIKDCADKAQEIKDWYIKYCNGRMENNQFIFTYIGIDYKVDFFDTQFSIYVL